MTTHDEPNESNDYMADHASLLLRSYERFTGHRLLDQDEDIQPHEAARRLFHAPFVVLSHDTAEDPVFNYGNKTALALFEMTWPQLTSLPSRKSAELPNREERARFLEHVSLNGFINDYSGVRISRNNKRFLIQKAVVWNLVDDNGIYRGQAATFSTWKYL